MSRQALEDLYGQREELFLVIKTSSQELCELDLSRPDAAEREIELYQTVTASTSELQELGQMITNLEKELGLIASDVDLTEN